MKAPLPRKPLTEEPAEPAEMKLHYIEVEAVTEFTRTYSILAEDEWAALAAYQANDKNVQWVKDSLEDDFECDENGDAVLVFAEDGETLLVDVADML